jgi:hypothetical protein
METFPAPQELFPDCRVIGAPFPQKSARDGEGLFRIVGGLADAPFIPLAVVTGNDFSGPAVESGDTSRIPLSDGGPGQGFCLLANRVAGREGLEAGSHPFPKLHTD